MITWKIGRDMIEGFKEGALTYWVHVFGDQVECDVFSETKLDQAKIITCFKEKKGTRKQ